MSHNSDQQCFNRNKVEALGVNQNYFYPSASWGVSGQPTDYIVRVGDPVGSMWGLVTDGFYTVDDFNYSSKFSWDGTRLVIEDSYHNIVLGYRIECDLITL